MQSSKGNYSMRHQVPMVSLLLLVYLSAVAYISIEISLGSCWHRDILRVKGQGLITNCNFYLCDMQSSSGNYSMRHQVPMVVSLISVYLSAVTCISEERNLGPCWRKDILRVKGLGLIKNCNFLWVGAINTNFIYWVTTTWCADKYSCLFLLLLLYLITVACILEISLGSCWHKDECMGQRSTIHHNVQLVISLNNQIEYAVIQWPLLDAPTSTHGVFTSTLSLSKYCLLRLCKKQYGLMLAQRYFLRVKGLA